MTNNKIAPFFKFESFGAVDGPGTRLVIFLQGCKYRCIYCHNPESWKIDNKKTISVDRIIELYEKSKYFYQNGGGITISGGEPLLHSEFLLELAKKCKEKEISLAIDTSACNFDLVKKDVLDGLIENVDLWIVDIKAFDPLKHEQITGFKHLHEFELIKLLESRQSKYWIRYVYIKSITDSDEDIKNLANYLKTLKWIRKFELLPFHNFASDKYKELNIEYHLGDNNVPSIDELKNAIKIINNTIKNN